MNHQIENSVGINVAEPRQFNNITFRVHNRRARFLCELDSALEAVRRVVEWAAIAHKHVHFPYTDGQTGCGPYRFVTAIDQTCGTTDTRILSSSETCPHETNKHKPDRPEWIRGGTDGDLDKRVLPLVQSFRLIQAGQVGRRDRARSLEGGLGRLVADLEVRRAA